MCNNADSKSKSSNEGCGANNGRVHYRGKAMNGGGRDRTPNSRLPAATTATLLKFCGIGGAVNSSVDMADNCQEDTPILNSFVINEGGLEDEVKTAEEAGSELRDGRSC